MSKARREFIDACVVFVDIIGFTALAERPDGDPSRPLRALEWLDRLGRKQNRVRPHYYFRISDSAVYVEPTDSDSTQPALNAAFLWARAAQLEAIDKGLLLRGGLTCGSIYCDQSRNMVFGPALSRAHSLESTRAVVPRVVVDPKLVPDHWRTDGSVIELGDGLPFIQYLGHAMLLENVPAVIRGLKKHGDTVLELTRASRSPRTLAKCYYLVEFHNALLAWLVRFINSHRGKRADVLRLQAEKLRITGFEIVPSLLLAGLSHGP
jgi:hypothetical protein